MWINNETWWLDNDITLAKVESLRWGEPISLLWSPCDLG